MKAPSVWTILGYVGLTGQILQSVPELQALFANGRKPTGSELKEAIEPDVEQFSRSFNLNLDESLTTAYCNVVALTYDRAASGKDPAEVAYEAYRAHTGGISLASGQPIPEWSALKPEIQDAWRASAKALVG